MAFWNWNAIQPWLSMRPTHQLHQFARAGNIEDIIDYLQYGDVEDINARDDTYNMTPYEWAKMAEYYGYQDDNVVFLFECLLHHDRKDVIKMFRSYLHPYTKM